MSKDELELFLSQKKHNIESDISKVKVSSNRKYQKNEIEIDWIYATQHAILTNSLVKFKTQNRNSGPMLDIGSSISTLVTLSPIIKIVSLEARDIKIEEFSDLNISFKKGEAQNIPFDDETFDIVSSLHAVEHFGLGRYGDSIDFYGDINGLKEMHRVLKPNGTFLVSVPITKHLNEAIYFNEQRVYSNELFSKMLNSTGFKIKEKYLLTGPVKFYNSDTKKVESKSFFKDDNIDNIIENIYDKNHEHVFAMFFECKRK